MSIRVRVLNCNNEIPPKTIRLPTAYWRISAYSPCALPPSSGFQPQRNLLKFVSIRFGKFLLNGSTTGRLLTHYHIGQEFLNPVRKSGTQTRSAYCHRLVFINQGQKLVTIVKPACILLLCHYQTTMDGCCETTGPRHGIRTRNTYLEGKRVAITPVMDVDAVCRSSVRLTDSCPTISLLPNTVVPQFIVECRHID